MHQCYRMAMIKIQFMNNRDTSIMTGKTNICKEKIICFIYKLSYPRRKMIQTA